MTRLGNENQMEDNYHVEEDDECMTKEFNGTGNVLQYYPKKLISSKDCFRGQWSLKLRFIN